MTPETSRSRPVQADAGYRVSAVIVIGEATGALEPCLRGVLGEPWVDEVVLVDCGAPSATASHLRGLQADRRDVRFIQTHEPTNYAQARNLGAQKARGRWLMFLDANVALQRGAAERMIRAGRLARAPSVIGGGLIDAMGRRMGAAAKSTLRRRPAPVEHIDGGFLLMTRADFLALGGFDEAYGLYGETRDICRRARDAGGAVWLQPTAEALHVGAGRAKNAAFDEASRAAGAARYMRKYGKTSLQRIAVAAWAPLVIALAGLKGAALAPFRRRK